MTRIIGREYREGVAALPNLRVPVLWSCDGFVLVDTQWSESKCEYMMQQLEKQRVGERDVMFGNPVPRDTATYVTASADGEAPTHFEYSNRKHRVQPADDVILEFQQWIREYVGEETDLFHKNRYVNEKDGVDEHRDCDGANRFIFSLVLARTGGERPMRIRNCLTGSFTELVQPSGTVLIFVPGSQLFTKHMIAKKNDALGTRFNVTARQHLVPAELGLPLYTSRQTKEIEAKLGDLVSSLNTTRGDW